jgi:hypothetical protein
VKHPKQRAELDANGTICFVRNEIVEWLAATGKVDLADITARAYKGQFDVEDLRQITQLLGLSLDAYYDLSYAEPPSAGVAMRVEQWLHEHEVPVP